MTEPRRLIEEDATDFERLLLHGGAQEQPPEHLEAKMLAGLGSAGAAASATKLGLMAQCLIGLGLVGGAWFAGQTWLGTKEAPNEAPAQESSEATSVTTPPAERQKGTNPDPLLRPAPQATAEQLPAPTRARQDELPLAPTTIPPRDSTLKAEVALLERGRAALAQGDADAALAVVAQYRRRFSSGSFAQEATVIEVRALNLRGDAERAERLKGEFLEQHPKSAHRQRLEESPSSP